MIVDQFDIDKDTGWKIVIKKKGKFTHALYSTHWLKSRRQTELVHIKIWFEMVDSNTVFFKRNCKWPQFLVVCLRPSVSHLRGPQKLWFQKSEVNTMLVVFFDWQGVVHKEFVPEGQAVNSEFYRGVMDWLLKRLQCIRLDKAQSGNWFLPYNIAPCHCAAIFNQFLAKEHYCFYHPLTYQIWHLQTTFYSLKCSPTLRGTVSTPL